MIPKECKRLAEVDFPIALVSKHSAREKSIRHGHPSTLHLWWARRPLAACRSMLLALLLPDPCDDNCPPDFKTKAISILKKHFAVGAGDIKLRESLLKFIGEFANWDLASNQVYLEVSRGLVGAAHGEESPLVVDPFAGGGSIPLEALRIGCEAFASDLNPVACLIQKTVLEYIPRNGQKLTEDLERVGARVKAASEKDLAEYYPADPGGARPMAYLWARQVNCEAPDCGARIPLVRSFWLCKKAERRRALRPKVVAGKPPSIDFEIFSPKSEKDVPAGTVTRAKATCPACHRVLSPDRVRTQLREQHGGADGARMLAVVTISTGMSGRQYRLPTDRDLEAVRNARKALEKIAAKPLQNGLSSLPNEPLPPAGSLGFRVQPYGVTHWGLMFSPRQLLALSTISRHLRDCVAEVPTIALAGC
jgi:putative DNA methylase